MPVALFDGWDGILRIILVAPLAYFSLILFLRISGKRTLTKLSAFDLVITVALGSTLATQVLSKDTPLFDGMVAMALLIALQWCVAAASLRWPVLQKLVRANSSVLFQHGDFVRAAMCRQRVSEAEVLQAIRDKGGKSLHEADTVYLQPDGSLAVIMQDNS